MILCGCRRMRLNEQAESIPEPMMQVGGMPILGHIMNLYAHFGFKEVILRLGYKGEKIREFFMNCRCWRRGDFTLRRGERGSPSQRSLELAGSGSRSEENTMQSMGLHGLIQTALS